MAYHIGKLLGLHFWILPLKSWGIDYQYEDKINMLAIGFLCITW